MARKAISNACAGLNQAVAEHIAKTDSIKTTIRNIRIRKQATPALPMTRQEIVFPEEYKVTKEGEPFLLFDSAPMEDRILIFFTVRNLRLLASSENWFGDGTYIFKTVPHFFYQLCTLHGAVHQVNSSFPLLYSLLPDKTNVTLC